MVNWLIGSGPLLLGVLILLTEALNWPRKVHYVWGGIAFMFGLFLLF
jgi:hypothetical protein